MTYDVLDLILKWLIPFVCGGAFTALGAVIIMWRAIRDGLCCLLRAEIIRQHEKWDEKGYCPIYAKESLRRAYKAYHALKGNDVATSLYEKTLDLPDKEQT